MMPDYTTLTDAVRAAIQACLNEIDKAAVVVSGDG